MGLTVARGRPPRGIDRALLASFGWAVFARQGHPIGDAPRCDEWARWPHIQVGTANGDSGRSRWRPPKPEWSDEYTSECPTSLRRCPILAGSDMLFTTLRQPFEAFARPMALRVVSCPLDLPQVDVAVVIRHDAGAAEKWLRDRAVETVRGVFDLS